MQMQSHFTAEAHKGFDFFSSFSEANRLPAALSEYPLQPETSQTLQNSLFEVPQSNYQQISNYSTLLPETPQTRPQVQGSRKRPNCTFGERSSMYRGISRYTGRFEAFLWDNTDPGEKPKTVYVGGFNHEKDAARAYDLGALKLWGKYAPINFPLSDYKKELEEMQYMTKKEYLLSIRRMSKGFSKGISTYRGVSRNSDNKKWQARLGKGKGMRGIYLGTFDTEEEAARAYDVAVIRVKGMRAATNFDLSTYDVKSILESAKLPIGKGVSKLLKKTSVDDVLLIKKRNTGKFPILCLQLGSSSITSSQPNPDQNQSWEQLQTLAAPKNKNVLFQQDCNNTNQLVLHQNPESQTNPDSPCPLMGFNLTEEFNLGFPSNGVSERHLTMMETSETSTGGLPMWNQQMQQFDQSQAFTNLGNQNQNHQFHQNHKHLNQVLHQSPSFPLFNDYQNHNFQTNPSFLHEFISIRSGLESNGDFPSNMVLDGNSTATEVGDICGFQNPESQTNPYFFYGLASFHSGMETNENFSSFLGGVPSSGVSEGSLTIMETNKNSTDGCNGGFPNEGQVIRGNSRELAEDFGGDETEFEIPSSWMEIFLMGSSSSKA